MTHIIGKVYDLTKENFNKVIDELDIEKQRSQDLRQEIERLHKIIDILLGRYDEI